jgi:hydroxymethylglutaryl-CoA lyase
MVVTERMLRLGCYEVSLGDTIGVGTPNSTLALLRHLLGPKGGGLRAEQLAVHFHNTYGQVWLGARFLSAII